MESDGWVTVYPVLDELTQEAQWLGMYVGPPSWPLHVIRWAELCSEYGDDGCIYYRDDGGTL